MRISVHRTVPLLAVLALITASAPAVLQAASPARSFGRWVADLSDTDREAVQRTQREVLEKMQPGTVSAWKDEKTGHSGEARLLRTYQQSGMSCAEVEHLVKITNTSRYRLPLCRANDGTWRLAY